MNAAIRHHQRYFFKGQWKNMRFDRSFYLQMVLSGAVLLSALAVVYVTNLQRMTLSQLESAEEQGHQLQTQWGQLLLEQASLARPSRVEQLAFEKLHMMLPTNKQTFVLRGH